MHYGRIFFFKKGESFPPLPSLSLSLSLSLTPSSTLSLFSPLSLSLFPLTSSPLRSKIQQQKQMRMSSVLW